MKKPTLRIAITGHIDHGKSTLLGRLLVATRSLPADKLKELKKIGSEFDEETEIAYLADQLKEERDNRITIETTEFYLKTLRRDYILIDTPGHLEFIKNMLTGASHADSAILMIDAGKGIEEQTRRHAYLIKLLSIPQVLVIVNKMDMHDYRQDMFDKVRENIRTGFKSLGLEPFWILPVSAKKGENILKRSRHMPWFKGPSLLKAMEMLESAADLSAQPLRFPVQDVYTVGGETVAVGKVVSGILTQGQAISVLPSRAFAKVREIRMFEQQKRKAGPGEAVGVILDPPVPLQRGDVLCPQKEPAILPARFTGNIFWMDPQPLKKGEHVTLRCSTQEFSCHVIKIEKKMNPADLSIVEENADELHAHEAGLIQFSPDAPAVIARHEEIPELGRYVIERNEVLQGAGTIVEHL